MARVPGLEPAKSRLHGPLGVEAATLLYRCFLLDQLDAVIALAPRIVPLVAFTPVRGRSRMAALAPPRLRLVAQEEGHLGQRMSRLLAGLLGDGHRGAIVMGSDLPTLPMDHVLEAAGMLETDRADLVLGPSDDGGYYLVGLTRPAPALFDGIPWSTAQVLALTLDRARGLGLRVHLLPPWYDVDTAADLARLMADLAATPAGPPRPRRVHAALHPRGQVLQYDIGPRGPSGVAAGDQGDEAAH
ncbi:MAG TPA: TIGR04282 family arsenosugar biosynthesis glycosyltransferase [Candidatus Limnocylindrales bacterium]|nr:TIGR04282 family arsenosugar biosynthesis glycosyltransferase [Candidatus Limnocylindrales bacterium]